MIPYRDLRKENQEVNELVKYRVSTLIDDCDFLGDNSLTETRLSEFLGVNDVVCCDSGTNALIYALKACGVGHGDEVITVSLTYISTTEAIHAVGARPVYVDVGADYLINVEKVEEKITRYTKAILAVDLYGEVADTETLRHIADKHKIKLIEDGAQAFGCERLGTWAHLTTLSFNPLKNLGGIGKGGAVFGQENLVKRVRKIIDHGRYCDIVELVGANGRMDRIQAEVLISKLSFVNSNMQRRREIAKFYRENLRGVITPMVTEDHSYYAYVIRVKDRYKFRRNMDKLGVGTTVHYSMPNHRQPAFLNDVELVNTDSFALDIVSIPCYHALSDSEVETVVEAVWQSVN